MNRINKLLILGSVLLLAVIALLFVKSKNADDASQLITEETSAAGETYFSVSSNEITSIKIDLNTEYSKETTNLAKSGETWSNTDDVNFPLNISMVEAMLQTASDIKSEKIIDTPADMSEYGLSAPALTVSFNDGAYTLSFGNKSAMSEEYYMTSGDGRVCLVGSGVYNTFAVSWSDLVQMEEIPDMTGIKSFTVRGENADVEILNKSELPEFADSTYDWYMNVDGEYKPLDSAKATTFMSNVTDLKFLSCKDYYADSLDLYNYKLDRPYFTITVEYDGGTFALDVGTLDGLSLCARFPDSNMVYEIDNSLGVTLLYTPYEDMAPTEESISDNDTTSDNVVVQ